MGSKNINELLNIDKIYNGCFPCKDLLGLELLDKRTLQTILRVAAYFKQALVKPNHKSSILDGKTLITLFYEPSTRTRISFELAAKKLSADVINIAINTSSITKGENLIDTGKTLEAMKADYIILRHYFSGAPNILAKYLTTSIINAGDGEHEHPTQGLLDLYTIYEYKKDFSNLKVLLVGDILHSRVAKSNIWALTKMGAQVSVVGPPTLVPCYIKNLGVKVYYNFDEAIIQADVINMLRIQFERQQENFFPSIREYVKLYQLTKQRLLLANPNVLVMHPGPMNRGIEISSDVIEEYHNTVVNKQVTNGIAIRMAILYLLNKRRC
ncbi:MAG: aspartate carbamoyltransferase catalytic subunit [Endomicrobium sp.]|jgi:aspartate carbamoyltransferase catalytic subunit|nr:aspartate carbamoyltransferase catalytic subunit [Endomicrobium sp.]